MSTSRDGAIESPSCVNNDAVREDPASNIDAGNDSDPRLGTDAVSAAGPESRVSVDDGGGSVLPKDSANFNESRALTPETVKTVDESGGALHNESISSVSRGYSIGKKKANGNSEQKNVKTAVEDYDSMLSEFDMFAAKRVGEAVGFGYEFGDMVWGKVKSHPWWPGYIYNEAFASPAVKKSKRNGHELVAFFGDSSYGWFELAELVPFEENFAEKSRQTSSRAFLKAVEEAVDEFSRRRTLGLACRCRNQFNFWPSNVEGYFVVDVGDSEPEVYSSSQINKARENFQPNEMLSFVQQLALTPMTNQQGTIEFIKNKAIVLACRKALFEEFDETYAQAFGTIPVRHNSPTMPVALNPAKAPLRGPLVMAEALGKGKVSAKPTKAKGRAEKDKYEFKRREESIPMNIKKASGEKQSGYSLHPLLVDRSVLSGAPVESVVQDHTHPISASGFNDNQLHATTPPASSISDIQPSEASRRIVEGGIKKAKVHKQQIAKLSAENASLVEKKKKKKRKKDANMELLAGESNTPVDKKRKKEIKVEASHSLVQLPLANSSSGVSAGKAPEVLLDVPITAKSELDVLKRDVDAVSSSRPIELQHLVNTELSILVRDLRGLALNPSHGVERGCPSSVPLVFLKYRSLVYQKSLAVFPIENERSDTRTKAVLPTSADKTGHKSKLMKPPLRLDDPTKGGKKRSPPDHSKPIKKKKLVSSEDIGKKKVIDSDGINKKKIISDVKLNSVEKKIPQRPMELQQENVKVTTSKNSSSTLPKPLNLQSSKKTGRMPSSPTMLVMKFPPGAALPSSAELRAKFARFGPMDHSATRVFWKTYTCRLVFRQKADAQAALNFAVGSTSLFGNTNVRSYIREVEVEAAEPVPIKTQKEESPVTQLKSCLKKPSEEGGNGTGRGTSRVKFVLGGEGNSRTQQLSSVDKPSSSMDFNKLPKLIPESSVASSHQFQQPINHKTSSSGEVPYNNNSNRQMTMMMMMVPKPPNNDISQQFLNLLTRCSDVVNSLSGMLGYVPYHSL